MPEEFYLPKNDMVGMQSASSKQARTTEVVTTDETMAKRQYEIGRMEEVMKAAFTLYRELLEKGWPRELARSVLPVATYSHMFATVNLLNLLKFLTLRCDGHAQYEIRVYAEAMRELIRRVVPVCVAVWEEKNGKEAT